MIRLTVSRNDHIYTCFPDIARTPDGTLVCIYRECMTHAPFPFSRISVRRSYDNGQNWTDRSILIECAAREETVEANRPWLEEDAVAGYEETRGRIREKWQVGASINCPRLICLSNGTLMLFADFTTYDSANERRCRDLIWRSRDQGLSWEGPEEQRTEYTGYQPAPTELRDGRILLGMDIPEKGGGVCFSSDGGKSWGRMTFIPRSSSYEPDEVSYIELDNGTIVGIGRNTVAERDHVPSCGVKVISRDGGRSWRGPFLSWMMGLEGRPKAGKLRSGEICVTYRCDMPNEMLAMHVMSQDAAGAEELGRMAERRPIPEDIPGRLAKEKGEERPWYMTSYYPGRTVILDIDRSVHRDGGYSGWVQLENGDVFVVDYINDDAPLAHIRGYRVSRSDYILFPDGDLPWLHPSWQPFRSMTLAMARDQEKHTPATL